MHRLAVGLLLAAAASLAAAQPVSVRVSGMFGPKALIVVDGATPKMVAPGESYQGIKVLSAHDGVVRVEIDGRTHELRVGAAPISIDLGAAARAERVVLPADGNGRFFTEGRINGKPIPMLIDTDTAVVTLSEAVAGKLGLSYQVGRRVTTTTVNGPAFGWLIKLDALGVGETVTQGVDAVVIPGELPVVLLGNNFLARFSVRRDSDRLTLLRR